MKKCTCCKQVKDLTGFFTNPAGIPLDKCKTCLINGAPVHDGDFKEQHADALCRYNAGKKYREIADDMGVGINTVKTWIRRGRLNLLGVEIR